MPCRMDEGHAVEYYLNRLAAHSPRSRPLGGTRRKSMEAQPLSAEDRAILALESETIVGHTCKVIVFEGEAPDAEALRSRITARIDAAPALAVRLDEDSAEPRWVTDDSFDLADHVVELESAPLNRRALLEEVARLFAEHLDRDRPLWRMDVLPLDTGGRALVWRVHHALADGTTTMRFAQALLWEPEPEPRPAAGHAGHAAADDARRRAHLAGFVHREFARSRSRSPFDGKVGTRRAIDFATLPLQPLHDAAKAVAGATLNDAVLAAVGGGVQRWLEHQHGSLAELRVKVPVSLHSENAEEGNRDSFFEVGVPVAESDPADRLRRVHAATTIRKADHDAEYLDALHAELRKLSPRLEHLCDRIEHSPRSFALNVSNVPGPREPVSVDGAPVASMHSIAEVAQHHALRVAVVSCAGNLHFGFCTDPEIVTGLDGLAAGVEAEADALVTAAT